MDIPLVLESLTKSGRLLPTDDWGPMAQAGAAYTDLAARWRGKSAVPTLAEMDAAWTAIQATPVPTEQKLDGAGLPSRVLAALVLRQSASWGILTVVQQGRLQAVIDQGAVTLLSRLS